ncbi:MAG: ribosome maturation factor RimP [Candidatus Hydrogenedentes bacterium]|nr:ribosome maturation factor RimP [Candidatus Hydrogenedentota bacterium]
MAKDDVIQRIWHELEPHLAEQGFELVEVEFGQHGHRWILRLFVDRQGGISLDDCAAVSQLLNPLLDASDVIEGSYLLEVSSPGIARPVRKPGDFARFTGENIKVRTHLPVGGRKKFSGVLTSLAGDVVTIDCQGSTYEICIDNIQRANLDR